MSKETIFQPLTAQFGGPKDEGYGTRESSLKPLPGPAPVKIKGM